MFFTDSCDHGKFEAAYDKQIILGTDVGRKFGLSHWIDANNLKTLIHSRKDETEKFQYSRSSEIRFVLIYCCLTIFLVAPFIFGLDMLKIFI